MSKVKLKNYRSGSIETMDADKWDKIKHLPWTRMYGVVGEDKSESKVSDFVPPELEDKPKKK